MTYRKIDRGYSKIRGRIKEISGTIPSGIHPVLRRFWTFARDMTRRFGKNLAKNREEELMKKVQDDFKKGI